MKLKRFRLIIKHSKSRNSSIADKCNMMAIHRGQKIRRRNAHPGEDSGGRGEREYFWKEWGPHSQKKTHE